MKQRSPIAVFLLPFVTFGIYSIVWEVKTKGEMVNQGADIPTAWLLIVPIANIWWMWKYSEGVEKITGEKISGVVAFLLLFLLGNIGQAIIQDSFNKSSGVATVAGAPVPVAFVPTSEPMQPIDVAPVNDAAPIDYSAPQSNPAPTDYSAPQSDSAPTDYTPPTPGQM